MSPGVNKPGSIKARGSAKRCGHRVFADDRVDSESFGRVLGVSGKERRDSERRPRCSELCGVPASSLRSPGSGAHGGAGFRRPRAACWRSRAAPPRSLARQLAAAWRVVTATAGGQRLPGAAGCRAAALRGDGFPRLRPARVAAIPREKDKDTRLETGQTRFASQLIKVLQTQTQREAVSAQQVVCHMNTDVNLC